jgi:hypothetical protein
MNVRIALNLTIFKLFIRNFLKNIDFETDFFCKISKNQQFLVCVDYSELGKNQISTKMRS